LTGGAPTRVPAGPRPSLLSPILLGIASGSILVPLNSTMLAVALPGVMDEFGLGADNVATLVSLYLGAVAIALPIGGTLGDRYGARRTFLVGVLAFGIASLIAAVAGSFLVLQVARVLQATSGALVSTSSAVLIRESAPAERRGEAFGLFDGLTSVSAAIGPFIGGVLVGTFGWRSMFVVAVPIALLSAGLVGFVLHPDRVARRSAAAAPSAEDEESVLPLERDPGPEEFAPARARRRIDVPGLVLLGLAIVAFLLALRGPGIGTPWLVATVALVPLAIAFVLVELRTDHPAVDPRLFRVPAFAAAVAGVFGSTVILHGSFILVPLAVERLLHESAATSGVVLLGIAGVGALMAPFGGRISDRTGRRNVVVAGAIVSTIGLAGLWLPAGTSTALAIALLLAVIGFGNGLTSPRQVAALESVSRERTGMAAGTYYTGRYLGGVVGASLAGVVLGSTVTAGGVSFAFGLLAIVGLLVALASLGLPGRSTRQRRAPAA
jgi:MFS family permease